MVTKYQQNLVDELIDEFENIPDIINIKLEIQDVLKNLVYNIENESYELTKHYYDRLRLISKVSNYENFQRNDS